MASLMSRPIQVYLEERQDKALRSLAQKQNVSLSELIRHSVDLLLSQTPIEDDPLWKIVGLGNSGVTDLATRHDDYLVDILITDNTYSAPVQ